MAKTAKKAKKATTAKKVKAVKKNSPAKAKVATKAATRGPASNCANIVYWRPVPSGSVFKIRGAGDQTAFRVLVDCSRDGVPQIKFKHEQVVPGPASQVAAKGETWVFVVVVNIVNTPQKPVVIEAWAEDSGGTVVTLPDANGTPTELHCQWQIASLGSSMITIFVVA